MSIQNSTISPLDLVWEEIFALGGVPTSSVPADVAYDAAIEAALAIVEKFGGSDPAARRHAAAMAAIDAEHDRRNAGVIAIGDHDREYLRTIGAVAIEMGARQ
jgi:hypothetical protein